MIWLIPFVWMLLGSVKTQGEILRRPPTWWPENPTLDNFAQWFGPLNFGQFFMNSLIVAVVTVLGNMVFCSMVGYALAKMQFPGKKTLFTLVMVTLMVPGVVTFVPLFVMVSSLGLVNTYPALILPFITAPIGVFLMRQFIIGIPDALLEAARLDGAGEWKIFSRIVMPVRPAAGDPRHPHLPRVVEQLPLAAGVCADRVHVHAAGRAVAVLHGAERDELRTAAGRFGAGDHADHRAVRVPAALVHPRRCNDRPEVTAGQSARRIRISLLLTKAGALCTAPS